MSLTHSFRIYIRVHQLNREGYQKWVAVTTEKENMKINTELVGFAKNKIGHISIINILHRCVILSDHKNRMCKK